MLESISAVVWGPFLLIPLLLLTGLYLTILLRGLQFRRLCHALWLAFVMRSEPDAEGDISHYQALTTALAATVGVGNIAGVATAIFLGGPGAVLWMWVTGLLGMATKYAEAFLGVRFRQVDAAGEQSGGPQFYLTAGIAGTKGRVLGVAFAVAASIAAFGIGNMVQSNTVADVHGRRFAKGQLSEEREALRVEALRHVGRDEEARRAAGEFKKRFPKSVLTKQMPADAP